MNFRNQRRVVLLRDVKKMKWDDIADMVLNLEKEHPTRQTVINCYNRFSSLVGHVKTKYSNCGRRAWKFTEDVDRAKKEFDRLWDAGLELPPEAFVDPPPMSRGSYGDRAAARDSPTPVPSRAQSRRQHNISREQCL